MSDFRKRILLFGSRRRLPVLSFTLALTAILCAVAATPVQAQNSTDDWVAAGGTLEVSTTTTLRIREGETARYSVRLTRRLPPGAQEGNGWWVMLHIDGQQRPDGEYDSNGDGEADISWLPSIGREFEPSDWPAGTEPETDSYWRDFRIMALEDDDEQDATIVLSHEVWDHDAYCPVELHQDNLPKVTLHIIDDDGPNAPKPELSIGDVTVTEGGTARFDVLLDTDSERDVTVRYRTSNGTAQSGSDYEAVNETLEIPAGQRSASIDVPTTQDTVYEGDETFTVTLSQPERATIRDGTGEGTITDDDTAPTLSIADATVDEGDTAAFEVTLSGERAVTATVRYSTMDGTAVEGSDYTAIDGGTLTFRPGDDSETILVRTREDSVREDQETFTVVLSEPVDATISAATGTGTINDDDAGALPSLRIEDATATEGGNARFTVTLSAESSDTVTVEYVTADGTARRGDDYTAMTTPATLTFTPSERNKTITVPTVDDQDYEGDETFTVRLRSPSGATIHDGAATGTIQDNDNPGLSINDVTVREGSPAQFTVRLEGPTDHPVTVVATTSDGTAQAGDDYTHKSETLTIPARQTTATFSVGTLADDESDSNETFTVTLSNPSGATLDDYTGTGTITEGGGGGGGGGTTRRLSIDDVSVEEGETARFTVTLSRSSNRTVTVDIETSDGSATAGDDYTAKSETLSIPAGQTTATFSVTTLDDDEQESQEQFTVILSGPSGATLGRSTGTGTIDDNDATGTLPQLAIADASAEEGDTVEFTVTLAGNANQDVTVAFRTADGTARAGSDYDESSGTLTFTPGDRTRTIPVPTLEDTIREDDETFSVILSTPAGATLADDTATGTITDDDTALPALSIADADPVTEGGTAEFEVTLSADSRQVVTVAYATADGTAVEDVDYTEATGTLSFQPGERTKTIPVTTLDDEEQESAEQFTVTLSGPGGATLDRSTGTGTIDDNDEDDTAPKLSIVDASAEEGDAVEFTVVLTGTPAGTVTVDFETADGTARAGSDYEQTSGTLTFASGSETQTINVQTLEDEIAEADERFTVRLSDPAGATVEDGTARGTIEDDDGGGGSLPILTIEDAAPVAEGQTASFPVTLSSPSSRAVTVSYATADGTARAGSDYTSRTGTLRFEPGEMTGTIRVPTLDDEIREATERFTVELSDPVGATLVGAAGTGSITDDDEDMLPALSIDDAAPVAEGVAATFVVTLSPASERTVSVSYRTVDGTATAGPDYVATDGTLRFEPGETSRTIAVTTLADELLEGAERFTVELSEPVAATIADGTGVGTITEAAERIGMVNRTVLPELGRALAFSTVRCRFERGLSAPPARDGSQEPAGYLSLPHALASDRQTSPMQPSLTLERALGNSSFFMPMQDEEGGAGRFAAWGCGDYRYLGGGGDGGVAWDGEAFSLNVGADVRLGSNALAGLSVSRSKGSFDYRAGGPNGQAGGGAYDLRLTGVHPYLGWSVSPGLDVWGTVGHAWGELRIADHLVAGPKRSAATLDSGAAGINGRLLERGTTRLNLKGEAALAQLDIAGDGALVETMAVNMRRLRLSTEASREFFFSSGGSLTPWGELGLRHDGGDGETGAGLEVGGGLRYQYPEAGWTTEGYGRWLAAHEGALREWGFGAVIRYDPGATGRGPSVSLTPGWGDTASGVQSLWERGATDPLVTGPPGSRLDAQFGYGFAAFRGRGVLTPFGRVSLDREYGNGYRIGSRFAVGRSANVSLEVERRERAAARAVYAIFVRGAWQF